VIIGERTISGTSGNERLETLLLPEIIEKLKRFESGTPFVAVRVNDPNLIEELDLARSH